MYSGLSSLLLLSQKADSSKPQQIWPEANEELFQALAAQWRKETRHLSSVSQMAMHLATRESSEWAKL